LGLWYASDRQEVTATITCRGRSCTSVDEPLLREEEDDLERDRTRANNPKRLPLELLFVEDDDTDNPSSSSGLGLLFAFRPLCWVESALLWRLLSESESFNKCLEAEVSTSTSDLSLPSNLPLRLCFDNGLIERNMIPRAFRPMPDSPSLLRENIYADSCGVETCTQRNCTYRFEKERIFNNCRLRAGRRRASPVNRSLAKEGVKLRWRVLPQLLRHRQCVFSIQYVTIQG